MKLCKLPLMDDVDCIINIFNFSLKVELVNIDEEFISKQKNQFIILGEIKVDGHQIKLIIQTDDLNKFELENINITDIINILNQVDKDIIKQTLLDTISNRMFNLNDVINNIHDKFITENQ